MSESITVEIPLDLAKNLGTPGEVVASVEIRRLIKAALPPEYPDGTIAWVTYRSSLYRYLRFRENGEWVSREHGSGGGERDVVQVEVIRTLGKGEMVVSRPHATFGSLSNAATMLARAGYSGSAEFLRQVADRL